MNSSIDRHLVESVHQLGVGVLSVESEVNLSDLLLDLAAAFLKHFLVLLAEAATAIGCVVVINGFLLVLNL